MEENLQRLSHCLNQASQVVQEIARNRSPNVVGATSNYNQTAPSTSGGMTSVSQAVSRARAMMH